ncbi:MAG: TerD family protein [Gemmatimonadetes bacterium]|nr:TerD family protein [Gemmatimonadota bacterium]
MGSFNLKKGDRFDLSKAAPGLQTVRIGMGWSPNEEPGGPDFDLDVSAFAIGKTFKIASDSHFVFYGQVNMGNGIEDTKEKGLFRPVSDDRAILGAIDDPDGRRSGEGDDKEDMLINLPRVSAAVEQIIICVTICKYPNDTNKDRRTLAQNFGMVDDCYIRILNESNDMELARYDLKESFGDEDAVEFGRLYRDGISWQFEAMGRGHSGSLGELMSIYT